MKGLIALFKFTTRLPLGKGTGFTEEGVGESMKFFPLVGIVIGLILFVVHKVLTIFMSSNLVIASIISVVYIILTGGLHLDGLSDTFDGIFSYRSKHRMLEIMKDSRVGVNGVIVLVMYFILKISLLAESDSIGVPMLFLVLVYPVVGRMNSVINCAVAPYARSSGMAKDFVEKTKLSGAITSILITLVYTYGVIKYYKMDMILLMIVPISLILGYYFAKLMIRKIDGVTGDTLGAVLELTQILALFIPYLLVSNNFGY